MPGLDLNEEYSKTSERIKSLDTYNQVTQGTKQLLSQQQSSFEQDTTNTASQLSQLQEQQKRFQRQVTSQLDKLLDLNTLLPNNRVSGQTVSSTASLIKNQFTDGIACGKRLRHGMFKPFKQSAKLSNSKMNRLQNSNKHFPLSSQKEKSTLMSI